MNTGLSNSVTRLQVGLYTGCENTPYTTWGRSFYCKPINDNPTEECVIATVDSIVTFTEDVFNWITETLSIPDKRMSEAVFTISRLNAQSHSVIHTDRFTYHRLAATRNKRKADIVMMLINQLLK